MINKLIKVQETLKAPKNQFNKFGGYNYRSCEDILEALKPLLAEQGLLLTITDEPTLVGERVYIKATASVTDGKTTTSATAYAREEDAKKGMDGSQVTGAASSYARKYALNGLFLIDDTKDADTQAPHDNQTSKREPKQNAKELAAKKKLKEACERLTAACNAYELCHPREDVEPGWAFEGVKDREDFPAKDAPSDKRAAWFNQVAGEFEQAC